VQCTKAEKKYTKWPQNIQNGNKLPIPNGLKMFKMDINILNEHKIYQHFPFQKYPNWYFWYENIPSGNPDAMS
jgi:hypothetical protein